MSRWRFTFWLDDQKPDELALGHTIVALKQERRFVTTVRDGIRLMTDLRAGRIDVLIELFPWIADAVRTAPTTPDTTDLERQIADLKRLIVQQGGHQLPSPPGKYPQMKTIAGAGVKLPAPLFDDDQDALVFKKSETSAMDASTNFFNQIAGYVKPAGGQQ